MSWRHVRWVGVVLSTTAVCAATSWPGDTVASAATGDASAAVTQAYPRFGLVEARPGAGDTVARAATGEASAGATQAYPPFRLAEASGLTASVLHRGVVWVVEDSGEPLVRGFDASGTQVGSVLFEASEVFAGDNRDTESLAMGPGPTLWSADIGDNNAVRETVLVHTTPEPADLDAREVTAVSYRFRYPDGPRDAEALLVDPLSGRAYVASKGLLGGGWYAAPEQLVPGATHDLRLLQEVPALVTGGDFSVDGAIVALRTWDPSGSGRALLYDVVRGSADEPVALEARGELALPAQEQGESLTFSQDGTALLVGSEGENEPIWSLPLQADLTSAGVPAPGPSTAAAAGSPQVSVAATPSDDQQRTCRRRIPGDCAATPMGLRILVVGGIVVLSGALVVAARRRR